MNIKFLLLGTSLSFIPTLSYAQCVATQDCATLGYTETSCNGGKGVKCPFGNKWACLGANEEECMKIACEKLNFKYSCTGTGYAGGAGSACNGKYAQCTCANGYEWKDESCQKQVLNGAVGDQYYCDGKIVGVRVSDMDFFVAIEDLGAMEWQDANSSCQNYSFCGNLKGRLPTVEELQLIYKNKSTINSLSTAAGGQNLMNAYYWSSTFNANYYIVSMSGGHVTNDSTRYGSHVRPVFNL